jgi:hypothetical protein
MGLSYEQLISQETRAKLLIYWGLGGYRGECRLMVLCVCMQSIQGRAGALCQIAVGYHSTSSHPHGSPGIAARVITAAVVAPPV